LSSTHASRALLVTANDEEAQNLRTALAAERCGVARVRRVNAAAEALHAESFDVVILAHPLPDADVIGSCATIGQIAGAPRVVLIDDLEHGAEFERTMPVEMRPALALCRPVDTGKLAGLLTGIAENEPALPPDELEAIPQLTAALMQGAHSQEAGVLEVRSEGVCTRIYFQDGGVVSVEGGSLRETLGRMLLRRGALSEADYVRVIERMTEQLIHNEQQRMGEVLVELGMLTADEVWQALSTQVGEKIAACYQQRGLELEYSWMEESPTGSGFDVPPVETIVQRGLKEWVDEADRQQLLDRQEENRTRLIRDAQSIRQCFEIDSVGAQLLADLDGGKCLPDLRREHPGALPLLLALLLTENLTSAKQTPARASKPVAPRKTQPKFAKEFIAKRKPKATEPEKPPEAADDEAAAPQDAANEAPDAGDTRAKLEAEQQFRRGEQLLAAERFAEALAALQSAAELQPLEPEYRMYEAWASYLNSRVELRVARAKAVACARRVLEEDPRSAKPHSILGRLALDDGERGRAEKEFEAALIRDPENSEAQRGISLARRGEFS
jgi:tetratricopeptide (TPR) repeat protein